MLPDSTFANWNLMITVMELPRNQQNVTRPLPGGKFSTANLNKAFKGSIPIPSKVGKYRNLVQDGSFRGWRFSLDEM